ncbi:MAG TPA: ABC transporter permease, partial [Verrucomicrobiae bacterium]|nr:ABC transporter permease [Verrucomicrobiae bacterium]
MSSRTAKHRILTALYTGIGIALALSSLFVLTRQPSAFPFRLSQRGAIEAPLILVFVLIAGLRATFNVPAELNANWMFQTVGDGSSPHFLKAVRKWVFFYRIIPLFALIAVFEFISFDAATAVLHLTFDLVISALLIEAFFFRFNKVPFTCAYSSGKIQLVIAAGAYLIGFTIFVAVAGGLKQSITDVPLRMAVFLFVSFVVLAILEKRRQNTAITYDENEAALLSLSADHGYWYHHKDTKPQRKPWCLRAFVVTLTSALQDFRYGTRILWKAPALSATAVILIALVIGLNTTIYSIIHAFITRPAPSIQAKNLVQLMMPGTLDDPFLSYPEYLEFAAETKTLHSLIGYGPEPVTLGTEDGSYGLFGAYVAGNYFEGLQVQIVRGRGLTLADERLENSGLVAVISYRVWQEQFRGVDDVIGRNISVNGHPATVIGVAAPLFQGAGLAIPEDVWVPAVSYFPVRGRQQLLTDRSDGGFGFLVLGQIQPNASLSEAQAEFAIISARLAAAYPTTNKDKVVRPKPYSATVNAGISHASTQFLAIFSVITALTLIIVCANVANLLLARAVERQRETALRQSLGASRARILRILVAEGVALSAAAWATASVFAYWVATYAPRLIVPAGSVNGLGMRPNHMNMDFSPDARVLAYAMLLAFIGTVFFCIAPALRMWNQELLPGLKTGEHGVLRGRSRLSSALVVVQLAFSVVLLTSAGLAYRSLSLIDSQEVGFNKGNLLLVTVNPTLSITNRESNLAFLERVRERFRTVAGVQDVSYVRLPPPYSLMRGPVRSANVQTPITANINFIGPDYLRVLGLTPILGREFSAADNLRNRKTAIVNQDLALALWPGQSPLGQTIPLERPGEFAE